MAFSESQQHLHRFLNLGTDSSAEELDRQYRQQLCRLVEHEMNQRYRRREDPEDVVQSVFRTFFRHAAQGKFHIENSAALWGLLRRITRRKILKHVEHFEAEKRNPRREEYGEADQLVGPRAETPEAGLLGEVLENVLDGLEPIDSGILRALLFGCSIAEVVEKIVSDLEPIYCRVLALRLQGLTETEVSNELGIGREAVRYRLRRICERLPKLLSQNG